MPTVFHHHKATHRCPGAPARSPLCCTHHSGVLPLQRHRHLHYHVKTKFLRLSVSGCRPPRASSPDASLPDHAAAAEPPQRAQVWRLCESPAGKARSGNFSRVTGRRRPHRTARSPRGREQAPTGSSLLPPGSADRTLASSSPPAPTHRPSRQRARGRRRGRRGLAAVLCDQAAGRGRAAPEGRRDAMSRRPPPTGGGSGAG